MHVTTTQLIGPSKKLFVAMTANEKLPTTTVGSFPDSGSACRRAATDCQGLPPGSLPWAGGNCMLSARSMDDDEGNQAMKILSISLFCQRPFKNNYLFVTHVYLLFNGFHVNWTPVKITSPRCQGNMRGTKAIWGCSKQADKLSHSRILKSCFTSITSAQHDSHALQAMLL